MTEDKSTEILKNAILLEKRGHAFYAKVAEQATGGAVRRFFELMAEEEVKHIRILSDQFKTYHEEKRFKPPPETGGRGFETAEAILSDDLKQQISAADYEAAAISAAMAMEQKAIEIYNGRSSEATDPNEKALYRWLADWEQQHLESLSEINNDITREIWHDNSFWPF
jgi:rubrerythrin